MMLQVRYVGNEEEQGDDQTKGLHTMDKTMIVKGARITYNIWEVEGIYLVSSYPSFTQNQHLSICDGN